MSFENESIHSRFKQVSNSQPNLKIFDVYDKFKFGLYIIIL